MNGRLRRESRADERERKRAKLSRIKSRSVVRNERGWGWFVVSFLPEEEGGRGLGRGAGRGLRVASRLRTGGISAVRRQLWSAGRR